MTNNHGLRGVNERLSPEQLKEFGVSVPQLVPWKRFGRAEEVAPIIAKHGRRMEA